jgi:hypothetical protein
MTDGSPLERKRKKPINSTIDLLAYGRENKEEVLIAPTNQEDPRRKLMTSNLTLKKEPRETKLERTEKEEVLKENLVKDPTKEELRREETCEYLNTFLKINLTNNNDWKKKLSFFEYTFYLKIIEIIIKYR